MCACVLCVCVCVCVHMMRNGTRTRIVWRVGRWLACLLGEGKGGKMLVGIVCELCM